MCNLMLSLLTLASGPVTDLDQLMERQDWLDEMRSESQKPNKKDDLPVFKSVCHGQPWAGNVYFRYEVDSNGEKVPVDAIFTDFQSCSYGRTGQDIAHFLLASTTREFRKNHLETILQAYLTELDDVIAHQGKIFCFAHFVFFGDLKPNYFKNALKT